MGAEQASSVQLALPEVLAAFSAAHASDDPAQTCQAAAAAARLCGDVAAQEGLGCSDAVVLGLASLLGEDSAEFRAAWAEAALRAVRNLAAGHAENCRRLGDSEQVVAGVVRLLGCGDRCAASCAAAALSNLCAGHRANQERFASLASREALSALLDAEASCRSPALLAIRSVSFGNPDNQDAFGSDSRVTSALATLLEDQDCQDEVALVLQTLSAGYPPNKERFGTNRCIVSGLTRAIEFGGEEGKVQAIGAIKNLGSHPPNQVHLGDDQALMSALLGSLESGNSLRCQMLALGAVQALCWNSAENKARIGGEADTVSVFARLLTRGGAVVPAAAAAIHSFCFGHSSNQELWANDSRIVVALMKGLASGCPRERRYCASVYQAVCSGQNINKSRISSDEVVAALVTAFAQGELPDRGVAAAIQSLSEDHEANKERFGADTRLVIALAKLLADGGIEGGRVAAAVVRTLCDSHVTNRERFGGDDSFLAALAEALTSKSSDRQASSLIVASSLCAGRHAANQHRLGGGPVVPALSTMLETDEINRAGAAQAISALCAGDAGNKERFGSETGVIPCLIGLLSNHSDDVKALGARVLQVLVDEHDENRIRVLRNRLAVRRLRELQGKSICRDVVSSAAAALQALDVE